MHWSWLFLAPATAVCFVGDEARGELRHPHFPKVLECQLDKDLTIKLRYQTATFNAEGAKAMKPGAAWHLAGATFETTGDLEIGGSEVAAGTYALSARKVEGTDDSDSWELVLHEGRGFSRIPAEGATVLETELQHDAPLFEHLSIDVHPTGDKKHTTLHLDVRFDTMLARTTIEVPK